VDNESQTDYDTLLEDINLDLETELKNLENAYSKSACKWPLLHQFLKDPREFKGTPVLGSIEPELDDINNFLMDYSEGLAQRMFSKDDIEVIEKTKVLLDFEKMAKNLEEKGQLRTVNRMFDSYFNAIKEITGEEHHSVNLISVEFNNLMVMIKEFNKKGAFTSIEFLTYLMRNDTNTEGIKNILQASLCAAMKLPTESIVESYISVYEHHFSKRRFSVTEEHRFEEFFVNLMAPELHEANSLLKRSLDHYFGGRKWNFFKKDIKSLSTSSKTMMRLKSKKSKFPFITK